MVKPTKTNCVNDLLKLVLNVLNITIGMGREQGKYNLEQQVVDELEKSERRHDMK
jgi:hypothetical protein